VAAVLFDGVGAAFTGGIFAVVIARLTVRWTRDKDAKTRDQQRSREASQAITAALIVAAPKVKLLPPGKSPDLRELQRVLGIELAVITDPELVERVSSLWNAMVELSIFNSCIQFPTPASQLHTAKLAPSEVQIHAGSRGLGDVGRCVSSRTSNRQAVAGRRL
jgi:hypothetical protein